MGDSQAAVEVVRSGLQLARTVFDRWLKNSTTVGCGQQQITPTNRSAGRSLDHADTELSTIHTVVADEATWLTGLKGPESVSYYSCSKVGGSSSPSTPRRGREDKLPYYQFPAPRPGPESVAVAVLSPVLEFSTVLLGIGRASGLGRAVLY